MTARGQVSCGGDLALIEKTKRPTLERWLERHEVPYDELLFGKPIGVYYVDDKALRPDEFVAAPFEKLRGGSGSEVELINDRVVKRCGNADEQKRWYDHARSHGFLVPRVNCCYGDTLDMEAIVGKSAYSTVDKRSAYEIASLVERMSGIEPLGEPGGWSTMIDRVKDHLSVNAIREEEQLLRVMRMVEDEMNAKRSFCHGDLTLENVLLTDVETLRGRACMIDPNSPPGLYSSYLLDLGKLMQSFYRYENYVHGTPTSPFLTEAFAAVKSRFGDRELQLGHLCKVVHYVRLLKYRDDSQKDVVRGWITRDMQEVRSMCS